jgi:hypothetical protein
MTKICEPYFLIRITNKSPIGELGSLATLANNITAVIAQSKAVLTGGK